jgi:hypothetical protein
MRLACNSNSVDGARNWEAMAKSAAKAVGLTKPELIREKLAVVA